MTRPTALLLGRLRPLLDQVLDLGPAEREDFLALLARVAPGDASELAALLAVEAALDAAHFLQGPPLTWGSGDGGSGASRDLP